MNANNFTERLAKLSPAKRALLELRLQQKAAADAVAHTIPRRATRESVPLSFAQQRLWFLNQLEPASPIYNESRAIRLQGSLDVQALQQSLNRIVARHEVLRTNFFTVDGSPQQMIADSRTVELPVIDLQPSHGTDRDAEAQRLLTAAIRRPFDLSRDLLLRVLLLRLNEQEHILLFVKHHIVSDAWSTSIFWRELAALYEAFASGRDDPLPQLPIQYADYALWQLDRLRGEILDSQLSYWRKQLENLATLQLIPDRPRPAVHNYVGDRQTFLIPQELADRLRRLTRREGVTLFMTLLAAFQTLLYRYTGQNDIAVGSPIAGRTHPELESLIGFFVNTLVFRTDVSTHWTFRQLLARVREVAWGAYQHQELPFEKLVAELQPDRNLGRNPLFQVVFAFQNVPRQDVALPGLSVSHVEADSGTTKFDLALFMWEEQAGLRGRIQYSAALFDADTIERLLGHFETILRGIVADPDQRLSDLPLLTEREKHQALVEWNNTAADYPNDACIHELFEQQAKKSPDSIAVVFENQQLTYGELNQRANQLAYYLRGLGVGRETLVGLCMERSAALIVGLLGILKAGGSYVPLDPSYPRERLAFMLQDTQAPVLLTLQRLIEDGGSRIENRNPLASILDPRIKVVCLDRDRKAIAGESTENLSGEVTADNLAYVIYTSGSTGKPKGVEIPHRAVARLLFGGTYARLDAEQTLLQLAPVSFDASTFEIWGALLHGAKCVLYPGRVPSTGELGELIRKHKITMLWLTASLFNAVIDEAPETLSEIQQLLIGGEALSVSHVRRALALLPDTEIINGYGPTESTTFACCYSISKDLAETTSSIPIGRPIGNTEVYVLDRDLQPTPAGVPGEVYIGGDGLARGYINQPELTAERFIPHPFSERPGGRLYKTGDLARRLRDGNIEFLGRADNQVKIRGYRIELGEIESVLVQHPAVHDAVALVREGVAGDSSTKPIGKQLVAYVVAARDSAPSPHELRSFLSQKLPDYMVPSGFMLLNSLPLMPNGKLDRKALSHSDLPIVDAETSYIAPRTATEKMLAAIWAEVLGVERVGVHDNFFELGGHSLLVVQLFARIAKVSGTTPPLSTLFRAPTVEQLARFLHKEGWSAPPSSLIAIQSVGSKPPFFCVHGAWGTVLFCRELSRRLGPDQPFYGLQAPGLEGEQEPLTRVEDMAAHHVREIRRVQPKGPYFLGGLSLGGLVAFEIAQQLHAQGQTVALLVLIDTHRPMRHGFVYAWTHRMRRILVEDLVGRLMFHSRNLLQLGAVQGSTYARERTRIFGKRIAAKLRLDHQGIQAHLGDSYAVKVRKANIQATRKYEPRCYAGKITLFKTSDSLAERNDGRQGWRELALGGLDVRVVPGDHSTMINESNVGTMTGRLRDCLEEAQASLAKPAS